MKEHIKSEQIGVRIKRETKRRLKEIAKQRRRSVSFVVDEMIEKGLENGNQITREAS